MVEAIAAVAVGAGRLFRSPGMLSCQMAIPSTNSIAARLLRVLDGAQSLALRDLRDQLADRLELSADDRAELVNGESKETRFGNRVGHARTLLVRLGLAEQPSLGAIRITKAGLAVLLGDRSPRSGIKGATSVGLYRALDADSDGEEPAPASSPQRDDLDGPLVVERDVANAATSIHVEVDDSGPGLVPELAAPLIPGPRALGRSIVLARGDPIPPAWSGMPEIPVTQADLEKRTDTVDRLHRAWASRQPLVIRLLVDANTLRRRATWRVPLWELDRRFEPWTDRLLFLVWNNSYDGRGGRSPRWHWTTLAAKAGAEAAPAGPAEVLLPGGEPAWVDGGPRRPFPDGAFGDQRVLHYLSVEIGSLRASPGYVEPRADLASDQLQAVRHLSGPARVIAPAGSGKTRVLTERLRHLVVDRRYTREQVVAVAYNKRAQEEMVRRTKDFAPRIQTLNSLGWEILRDALPGIQFIDSELKVRDLLEKHCPPLDRRANTDPLAPYLEALNITRQALLDPDDVETRYSDIAGFGDAFRAYRAELVERNLADYDEQLYRTMELLLADAELRRRWQAQCRHLLVDEFQDLTPLHLLMIRTLASPALDVFGTGDDDQVIYGYAGADPRFLIDFTDLFPGAAARALEVNYRCPPAVVTAARTLLTHNRVRVPKRIRAARPGASTAMNVLHHSPEATAATIVAIVHDWLEHGSSPGDIAVLCRVNAGLVTPQVALHTEGIPVINAVNAEILQRTGVRSALAYLRLAHHPDAMRPGDLEEAARRPSRGFSRELIYEIRGRRSWTPVELRELAARQSARVAGRLHEFIDDLHDIGRAAGTGRTSLVLNTIRQAGLEKAMHQLDAKSLGESHIDDLDALANLASLHPEAASFETWLRDLLTRPSDHDGVTLSTVHRVKGEEWERVLVIEVRDGVLPHRRAKDVEEERRILHVAITRGREEVIVLTDRTRPSVFVRQLHEPWAERRPVHEERVQVASRQIRSSAISPSRGRARGRATQSQVVERGITATVGMTLEATGGYRGDVLSIDQGGVYIETSSGGCLRIKFGERVKVNHAAFILREA